MVVGNFCGCGGVIRRIKAYGSLRRDDLRSRSIEDDRSAGKSRARAVVVGDQNDRAGTWNIYRICTDDSVHDHIFVRAKIDGTATVGGDCIYGHIAIAPGDHVDLGAVTTGSDCTAGGHVISGAHVDHRVQRACGDRETSDDVISGGEPDRGIVTAGGHRGIDFHVIACVQHDS